MKRTKHILERYDTEHITEKASELLKGGQAFIVSGGCEDQASSITFERVKESVLCVPSKKKQIQESYFIL